MGPSATPIATAKIPNSTLAIRMEFVLSSDVFSTACSPVIMAAILPLHSLCISRLPYNSRSLTRTHSSRRQLTVRIGSPNYSDSLTLWLITSAKLSFLFLIANTAPCRGSHHRLEEPDLWQIACLPTKQRHLTK